MNYLVSQPFSEESDVRMWDGCLLCGRLRLAALILLAGHVCQLITVMDVLADEWSVKNNNWFSLFTLRYQWERTTMADVKWGHPQPSYITHIISHWSPGPVKLGYKSLMMWAWWWWPGTDQKLHNGQESHDPSNLRFLDCRMGSIMEGPIKRGNTSYHYTTHHSAAQRGSGWN